MKKFYEYVETVLIPLLAVSFILMFLFRVVTVSGPSMENTLHDGERIIVTHLYKQLKIGDIIVTDSNNAAEKPLVKRVIAVAGDSVRVDYDNSEVYINGQLSSEPYIKEDMINQIGSYLELTVPDGCIYVMGDNRNNSSDSRSIGPINEKCVLGRVVIRIAPLSKIGKVK